MAMEIEAKSSSDARWYIEEKLIIDQIKLIEGQEPMKKEMYDDENLDFLKGIFRMNK